MFDYVYQKENQTYIKKHYRDKVLVIYSENQVIKHIESFDNTYLSKNILDELLSLLYKNDIINIFKTKGVNFRTNNFYETVCDVLFEYEEDSTEYQLLNKFIILAADYQIT